MGADIHGVLQQRYSKTTPWRTFLEIDDTRSYLLFSILADVRNYSGVKPIDDPRGFPEGFEVEDENHPWHWAQGGGSVWMGDHSYTWLTVEEIEKWPHWDELESDYGTYRERCGPFWAWLEYGKTKADGDELRIVIGFDS